MKKIKIGSVFLDDNKKHISHYVARIRNNENNIEYINLSRDQVEKMYSLYSKFGSNLSQSAVATEFSFTQANIKRIFNDLGIRKDSPAVAPHVQLENPDAVLDEMSIMDRIQYASKRSEMLSNYYNRMALTRVSAEYEQLKKTINDLENINLNINGTPTRISVPSIVSTQSLNIYLADIHIGAIVPENGIYDENKNYGRDEILRRLTFVLNGVADLGHFDTINVVLLGDSVDCAGQKYLTARGHGLLDENMEPLEQVEIFLDVIVSFMSNLIGNNMANKYRLFAVPCGNHDGNFGTLAHKLLIKTIKSSCPDVEAICWDKMIGHFEQDGVQFLCLHGKDERYMKRAFSDILNEKICNYFNSYVLYKKLKGDIFHIVKGDLHTEAQSSSCRRFTYRNALSLFGSSEYANRNYPRNSYGVSYDIIRNGHLIRGTFQDM